MSGLANVLAEHGGALDYDLMTRTPYCIDDLGGRLQARSLSHFLQHLPPESETKRALFPEDAEKADWLSGRVATQLLAVLVDELRGMEWVYSKVNSKGSVRRPAPFPTPWTDAKSRGYVRYGSAPVTVAEFDEWFDRKEG